MKKSFRSSAAPASTAEQASLVRRLLKMLRSKLKWIILLLIVIIAASMLISRFTAKASVAQQTDYMEQAAERRTITQSLTASGTLEPADAYTVTTLMEGDILTADFEEGDVVEKDTVLYQIDSSDSETGIEKAEISLSQAQRSYASTADSANVKANATGTVYALNVELGDAVNAGEPIATIRDSATMLLTVPFPADDAAAFTVGQSAVVTLDGTFETLSGVVSSVSATTEVRTGNVIVRQVKIAVTNPGGLSDTQSATASIAGVGCSAGSTFAYRAESAVSASTSGTVTAIQVPEGGAVTRDQTIVTIGGTTLNNQIQSAADSVRNAEISLQNQKDQLDNYTITSPIAGTIVDKGYKVGDTVESGKSLCTIYDLSHLEMTMSIDELDISEVAVGQAVTITADAVDGKTYEGYVTKVSVAGTTSGGITSYPVTVQLDEFDGLLPGMNVDAEIVIDAAEDVLAIPAAALSRGNRVLITASSPSAANALEEQAPAGYVYVSVETGFSNDSYLEVTSGLQEGDTVAYEQTSSNSGMTQMGMMGGMAGGGMPGGGMPSGGGGAPGGRY
ncbi:MAG: HlyD family efflux transporter periplasmic adaptor subunit [Oscillospiraceae bacterium]|nr:HlyD family efflux transporter periplasmic adaptor subunit [Oscillospiraceae bacterium]